MQTSRSNRGDGVYGKQGQVVGASAKETVMGDEGSREGTRLSRAFQAIVRIYCA